MNPSPGRILRDAVEEATIQIPGTYNALVARIAERLGYDAVYLSGGALSAGVLAQPDVGLFTLTELVAQATYLTRAISLPVVVDADTGFGDAANVVRTMVELEGAGVAAVQLEDQQLPKRCGQLSGKTLIEPEAMCAKLQAAKNARSDPELVIIARTDARDVEGLEQAISRARRYVDAGADWVLPEALSDRAEFERFAREIDAPLVANMTEFGRSPMLTLDELGELGYAAVLYPMTVFRVALKAVEAALALLASEGTQAGLLEVMLTRGELYDLLDYQEFDERDQALYE